MTKFPRLRCRLDPHPSWDWFVVREAQRDLKIRNNGALNYRDLNVWIADRLRVIGRKEAAELDGL